MFPTFVLTPEVKNYCHAWANKSDWTHSRHPGSEYERAMGRFGELCVYHFMKENHMVVKAGPDYRQDITWLNSIGHFGVEVKTKVSKYEPKLHYYITVDSENYEKQHKDAQVYVFGWVYQGRTRVDCTQDTLCSIVGFELSTAICKWQWFDAGDKYPESGWTCRYPTYRNVIDALKPVDVLYQYVDLRL